MPVEGLFNTTVEVLSKSIDLRTRQQNLIASNIANAETPGYVPNYLDFESELQSAVKKNRAAIKGSGTPAITSPAHIPLRGGVADNIGAVRGKLIESPAKTPGRDGNSVEPEGEMNRMMQNQILFNASAQLLTKKFEGIRTALKEGR